MRFPVVAGLALVAVTVACTGRDRTRPDSARAVTDSATGGDASGGFEPDERGKVQVRIVCSDGAVEAVVRPWKVREKSGTEVRWHITPGSNVDRIEIAQHGTGPWVLTGKPPFVGRPGAPAIGGTLAGATGADSSAYSLRFWCGDVHGVIDPDIIVLM